MRYLVAKLVSVGTDIFTGSGLITFTAAGVTFGSAFGATVAGGYVSAVGAQFNRSRSPLATPAPTIFADAAAPVGGSRRASAPAGTFHLCSFFF